MTSGMLGKHRFVEALAAQAAKTVTRRVVRASQKLAQVAKREGEDYDAFVARAATNPIARRVKLADLEDNMDVRRLEAVTERDAKRLTKYLRAWRQLKALQSLA